MKPVIALIRTAPPTDKGSMPEYARMVEAALRNVSDVVVKTCDLFPPRSRSMWHDHLWRFAHARRVLSRQQGDLFHLLDGSMLAFVPRPILPRTLVTVHDLIPWLQLQGQLPGRPSFAAAWLIKQSAAYLQSVAGICVDSKHTRGDVEAMTGRTDVETIPLVSRHLPAADSSRNLPGRFVLHIGNNAAYKNRMGVLRVFARLSDQEDLWLLMAGPAPTRELQRQAGRMERVRFLVGISDADLAALYLHAELLLFPSLYEGFGMPVREAQAAGCPVVCSTAASLPEVAGDAALMADPRDVEALALHCRTVLADQALRKRMSEAGRHLAARFSLEQFQIEIERWYQRVEGQVLG